MYFIKIKQSDLLNEKMKKRILLLWYLYENEKRNDIIECTINDIVKYFHYTPSNNKTGINNIIKEELKNLINDKLIICYQNISLSTTNNEKLTFSFVKEDGEYKFLKIYNNFVQLKDYEMKTILNYYHNNKTSSLPSIDFLIILFLTIKSFMYETEEQQAYCYPSYEKLQKMSNISKQSISKILKILKDMHLIYSCEFGTWKTTKGVIKDSFTIYSLKPPNNEKVLKTNVSANFKDFKEWI